MGTRHSLSADDVVLAVGLVAAAATLYVVAGALWNAVHGTTNPFFDLMTQWDSGWYLTIIDGGYHTERLAEGRSAGSANWAFFPLYPLLVRLVVEATGLRLAAAGVLTSAASLCVAVLFALDYLRRTRDERTATYGVVLLALGPYAFYSLSLMTEGLFLALVAVGLWCLTTGRFLLAGAAGGLLSATRPTGLLFGVAMAVVLWRRTDAFEPLVAGACRRRWRDVVRGVPVVLTDGRVLALGLVPVGLLAYALYLWVHVGDPLAFVHVQSAWGRSFGNPLRHLGAAVLEGAPQHAYYAAWALLGLGLSADLVRRGRVAEGVLGLLLIIVPLSSGVNSLPRYVYGTGVVAFAAADWLGVHERWAPVLVAAGGAANVVLLWAWFGGMNVVN